MTKRKHPFGSTVGTMIPENEVEYFVCDFCQSGDHKKCTGLARDAQDNKLYSCECGCEKSKGGTNTE